MNNKVKIMNLRLHSVNVHLNQKYKKKYLNVLRKLLNNHQTLNKKRPLIIYINLRHYFVTIHIKV